MNLASCEICGVVYDKQRIPVPNIYTEDYDGWTIIDRSKAKYNGDAYEAIFKCPNCGYEIFYETGDEA